MPYILLIIGVGIGVYALYNFLRKASRDQAQKLLLSLAIAVCLVFAIVLIIAGRYPIAAILTIVMIPIIARLYTLFNKPKA
jgi:uncharacterized membrane protein YidH (DUF202 family)